MPGYSALIFGCRFRAVFFAAGENYYFNSRYYDPQIARFTTADNVIDGQLDTQGWNRYSYVHNNPIIYRDPTGHWHIDRPGAEKGHEVLSELAMKNSNMNKDYNIKGNTFNNDYLDYKEVVVNGNKDVDFAIPGTADFDKKHNAPEAQATHFLRKNADQSTKDAVNDGVSRIQEYLNQAKNAGNKKDEYFYLGKALHTMQDSFAPAHTQRSADGKILNVYDYKSQSNGKEDKHSWAKDSIDGGSGTGNLTPQAVMAVKAGKELINHYMDSKSKPEKEFNVRNSDLMKYFETAK